jgi:hypothetical protein
MCVYQFRHLGRCVCSKERNYSRAYRAVKHFETQSETWLRAIAHMAFAPMWPGGRVLE